MQRIQDNHSLNGNPVGSVEVGANAPLIGQFCETTSRIVIVSPLPASLHSLIAELTARCYDVLVFHHEHDPLLSTIDADLLLQDRTVEGAAEEPAKALSGRNLPVISLVSPHTVPSRIEENFLYWPSPLSEVLTKIEDAIGQPGGGASVYGELAVHSRLKDVVLDEKRMTVHQADRKIDLTRTEFQILKVLLDAGGAVLSRQELLDLVWGNEYFGGSNAVDVHIKSLRQKLGDDSKNPKYIATVRGVGYRTAD